MTDCRPLETLSCDRTIVHLSNQVPFGAIVALVGSFRGMDGNGVFCELLSGCEALIASGAHVVLLSRMGFHVGMQMAAVDKAKTNHLVAFATETSLV